MNERAAESLARVLGHADTSGECWTWTGCKNSSGHGRVFYQGSNRQAHRVVYELLVGPISSGMTLQHACGNSACVNPEHIRAVVTTRIHIRDRFWHRCEKQSSGCWSWTGGKTSSGYGTVSRDRATRLAHRMAWELAIGPIPVGKAVLHRCDNPPCINPSHLFLGTLSDNTQDMIRKGRHVFTMHPERHPHGEKHPLAKLTCSEARQIADLRGLMSAREIAAAYGVSQGSVTSIFAGRSWKHALDGNGGQR